VLKRFVSSIKSFFNPKLKTSQKSTAHPPKDSPPKSRPRKGPPHERSGLPRDARSGAKKETREEYSARKAKQTGAAKRSPVAAAVPVEPELWEPSLFKIPVVDGKTRFHDFVIVPEVMHAVYDLGFQYCTPVQAETLAQSLSGDDVVVRAQTGTGKTAAFLITIFHHIVRNPHEGTRPVGTPRALILAPTRELVMQIEKDARGLGKYVPSGILSLLGGIDYAKQQNALKNIPCDVLICTPGRLIDFKRKRLVDLSKIEILVLDEADRMLDMGFIDAVRSIVVSTPPKAKRQTMFFSATMSGDVRRLADSWTRQAFEVNVTPDTVAVDTVEQITYITTHREKPVLLYNLINQKHLDRVLIFANRRDEARELKETLETYGINCALLSGDVDQKQRVHRLERFREGKVRVLVATNVASRGLHVEGISHVINYNMPLDVEEYVHRIGRTGRAGASGISISFADEYDSYELVKLEEFLGKKIACVYPEPHLLAPIPEEQRKKTSDHHEEADKKKASHSRGRRPQRRT
jgi:ATP-dependent RNA helicase RhlB